MSGSLFTERERKEFSLSRWLDHQAEGANGNSLETEMLAEFARVRGESFCPTEAVIPWELLTGKRTLTATNTGAQFVSEKLSPAQLALRAGGALVGRLGCQVIDAPPGSHRVPLVPAPTDAQWWDADGIGGIEVEQPALGAGRVNPRTMASLASYSKSWERESLNGPDVLSGWLLDMIARTLDRALLTGAGGIEPLGVANTPGVQTGAVDGTGTWPDLCALEEDIEAAEGVNRAWVASPNGKALLRSRAKSSDGEPIWTGTGPIWASGAIDGTPAVSSPICPDGRIFAGDWSSVQVYLWGGPKIATKFTGRDNFAVGRIQMRVIAECDVIALRPERLAVATLV